MSANQQALCTSFKAEVMSGTHALGTPPVRSSAVADTFMAALFYVGASLGAATTAYNVTNEVSGTGYTAGGVTVANGTPPTTSGTTGYWTPSAPISLPGLTISSPFDSLLIYNSSQGNRAVCVLTFVAQTISVGTFTYTMPTNAAGSALINLT